MTSQSLKDFPATDAPLLILQPHYDDAALSCGGLAALAARTGRVGIVTVFASELVEAMVGDFAAWKHSRWKIDDIDQVVRARRREDECAARALGCDLRWLGLPDAIYRGEKYASDTELFGDLHDEEYELAAHLADELRGLPEWTPETVVLVPLGIGGHVDHQLVFEAGRRLANQGVRVLAYEDAPYVIHTPSGLERRLARIGAVVGAPVGVDITETLETKIRAVNCYASQLPVIFRFTDDPEAALRDFAFQRGGVAPAERFWPVTGDAAPVARRGV